jgi:hypothetical protein
MTTLLGGLFALMLTLTLTGDTAAALAASVALIVIGLWELR